MINITVKNPFEINFNSISLNQLPITKASPLHDLDDTIQINAYTYALENVAFNELAS